MQMTSKLEEPGRKAAIINKTKREDVGTSPGVFLRARWEGWDWGGDPGDSDEQKATRSPSRSSLRRRGPEKEGKEANASSPRPPPHPRNSTQKVTRSATSPALLAFSPLHTHTHRQHHPPSHQQERERNKKPSGSLTLRNWEERSAEFHWGSCLETV